MRDKEKVIIRKAPDYDPEIIKKIIQEGIEDFSLASRIKGRITIKPNVVIAHPKIAPSAFTRAEFLDGLLGALEAEKKDELKIVMAEKTGAGLPTARMFRHAGYLKLKRKHKIKLLPIEEAKKKTVHLHKGEIQTKVTTAREIVDNDFLVYTPKLKSNVLSQGLSAALKLNIGLLLDRERMQGHNFDLDRKIVDLLEVGTPDFIATDAVEIGTGGNQLTQHGRHLGIILMATNPLAHDVVCAHILHLDPQNIQHLRLAHERGYGPLSLDDIEIDGDIALEEIQQKTKNLDLGMVRVDEVDCNIRTINGEPYCVGGCHGIFLDWLYMFKDRKPELWKNMPAWTVVIGQYAGDVSASRLMVIGTCSKIDGKVQARKRRKIRGCPPKHKYLVLQFLLKAGIINPLFRLDIIIDAYLFLFVSWLRRLVKGRL
ncbi:MAG: DUF362 domain-containing protein [Candidatus Aminicenantes bacterium]|nr:MAG: DUF362 domain-containing protein [Candidatus Aminicenantes bacterium]